MNRFGLSPDLTLCDLLVTLALGGAVLLVAFLIYRALKRNGI